MACKVCHKMSKTKVKQLNAVLTNKAHSLFNDPGLEFGLSAEDVKWHSDYCLTPRKPPALALVPVEPEVARVVEGDLEATDETDQVEPMPPPKEVLTPWEKRMNELEDLEHYLEVAKSAFEGGDPDAGDTYAKLLKEFRGMVVDIESAKDPQEIVHNVTNIVISPLIRSIVSNLTQEFNTLREQVLLTDPDPSHTKRHVTAVNECLSRLGTLIKGLLDVAIADLGRAIDDKDAGKKSSKKLDLH